MAAQNLKKTCNLLIVTALITMMFSAQISHSNNVEMCIKHCVSNQCLKEVKNATSTICEDACKKLCNDLQNGKEKYIVPTKSRFCRYFPDWCGATN
ncbi:hypothetical protein ISN44_As06g021940 [Arabidopsis suecica]|uniref:Plant thionin family protein n=1 Tax=Arabidopsis suecica TaxID=45249 RepID=A0A8T2CHW2_ARASU|nr:hypothetical protein ISN44_As06g021940 [Arabidopsis suecica]